ncbi:MAG TPA: nitroreductase/quinone reductase family protein [Ilumatobacteraceae bacterium]|nr:nitroreductase/quinone reductase family protein [Ilumatobacteraceae bacterium]
MSFANSAVVVLLRSPLHRVMSGSTDLIRYTGTRSGRIFVTPTQYVVDGDDLIIMAGRPETKSWWRNFVTLRDVDVLLRGKWVAMIGEAVLGVDQPEYAARLLDTYLARYPRAARSLGGDARAEQARRAVFVVCRPRSST